MKGLNGGALENKGWREKYQSEENAYAKGDNVNRAEMV